AYREIGGGVTLSVPPLRAGDQQRANRRLSAGVQQPRPQNPKVFVGRPLRGIDDERILGARANLDQYTRWNLIVYARNYAFCFPRGGSHFRFLRRHDAFTNWGSRHDNYTASARRRWNGS